MVEHKLNEQKNEIWKETAERWRCHFKEEEEEGAPVVKKMKVWGRAEVYIHPKAARCTQVRSLSQTAGKRFETHFSPVCSAAGMQSLHVEESQRDLVKWQMLEVVCVCLSRYGV